jgi:hypothetical protein
VRPRSKKYRFASDSGPHFERGHTTCGEKRSCRLRRHNRLSALKRCTRTSSSFPPSCLLSILRRSALGNWSAGWFEPDTSGESFDAPAQRIDRSRVMSGNAPIQCCVDEPLGDFLVGASGRENPVKTRKRHWCRCSEKKENTGYAVRVGHCIAKPARLLIQS